MPYARLLALCTAATVAGASLVLYGQQPPAQPTPPATQQPDRISTAITGSGGAPKLAVPDFIPLSTDAETRQVAQMLGEVLLNDMAFEREFYMVPRKEYGNMPAATSVEAVPFDRWKELGAEGVVIGTVRKTGAGITVQVRLFRSAGSAPCSRRNTRARPPTRASTPIRSPTRCTSSSATSRAWRARSSPSRRTATASACGPDRGAAIKEIYISDYDGANPRRITVNRSLNITPVWSADGKAIAYTSYRRNDPPDVFVSYHLRGPAARDAGQRQRARSTTSCRPGRPTARRSRS